MPITKKYPLSGYSRQKEDMIMILPFKESCKFMHYPLSYLGEKPFSPLQNMTFPGPYVEIQLVFQGMIFLINLLQMSRCQVQINLRRVDALMAKEELDFPNIRPGIEKMGSEAVPDNMRRYFLFLFDVFQKNLISKQFIFIL